MAINKAYWSTSEHNVRLTMPITKVDQENRIVSGWASLDNIDTQGDVVLADANAAAFSDFRGNIREMHQPIAVGRMVNFREDVYYDPNTNDNYRGIYVDVYVSKGAQDTWEKVLDGTLSGFSIGGEILDSETTYVGGQAVRIIKSYVLVELSLVDNPANQLANVFSITKNSAGEMVLKGMLSDAAVETVYWCETDQISTSSATEKSTCDNCGGELENIGWVEFEDEADKLEKIKAIVKAKKDPKKPYGDVEYADPGYQADGKKRYPIDTADHVRAAWSYINQKDNAAQYTAEQLAHVKARIRAAAKKFGIQLEGDKAQKSYTVELPSGNVITFDVDGDVAAEEITKAITKALEGGNMTDNSEVEETETTEVEEAVAADEETEAVAEDAEAETEAAEEDASDEAAAEEETAEDATEEVSEVEETDIAKMFGDLQAAIEAGLAKTSEEAQEGIRKATEAFDTKFAELAGKHDELTKSVETLKETLNSVEKSVQILESETAVKKSGDLGGSTEETLTKSKSPKWGGRFLGISDLQD